MNLDHVDVHLHVSVLGLCFEYDLRQNMFEVKFHYSVVCGFCLAFGYGIHHVVVCMSTGSILIDAGITYLLDSPGGFPHIIHHHVFTNRSGIERVKVQSLGRPITKIARIVIIPLTIFVHDLHSVMFKIRVDLSHEGSTIRRKSEHVEIGARQVGGGSRGSPRFRRIT